MVASLIVELKVMFAAGSSKPVLFGKNVVLAMTGGNESTVKLISVLLTLPAESLT